MNELERVEAAALRDAVVLGGGRAELVGGALCVAHEAVPVLELNRAIPVGEEMDVDAIAAWYAGERHMIAAKLDLRSRGYAPGNPWMKFERDAAPAPRADTGLRIEETLDAGVFGPVAAEGSGLPAGAAAPIAAIVGAAGWHCFIAFAGDEPAASGALYVDGRSAWLGIGATRPPFRRRGAQSALLAARIDRARTLGAALLTTETGAHDRGSSYRKSSVSAFGPRSPGRTGSRPSFRAGCSRPRSGRAPSRRSRPRSRLVGGSART
jgi:GNAT superfamily N-acetyltransferase